MTRPRRRPVAVVDILTVEDCPGRQVTVAGVEQAIVATGVAAEVRTITVTNTRIAVALGFGGPPPSASTVVISSLALLRRYRKEGSLPPVPDPPRDDALPRHGPGARRP